jgi:ABC-type Fe3+/spermidine/putrescine transport system ATPase subunit
MQVEIKEIQQRLGMTVVYVTHDQEEAMNLSDRIAIMNSGRIEQVGRPAEIYDNPASNFIARFLGEANLIEGTVQEIRDGFAVLRTAAGLELRARVVENVQPAVQAHLFVRPERVTLAPAGAGTQADPALNHATGSLVQTSFLGNILRHAVEIEPGIRVTVDVQNASSGLARSAGENTRLSWRPADSVILQR